MRRVVRSLIGAPLTALFALGVIVALGGCVAVTSPGPTETFPAQSPPPRPIYPSVARPAQPPPPQEIEVTERPPRPSGDHVVFFSEPYFRGESFIVETGAAVEDLRQLPRDGGSWSRAISSFRMEGVATVVAYPESDFRGPRLETSASMSDLRSARGSASPEATWDNTIASLRVLPSAPPQSFDPPPPPRLDRRTAEIIVQRAYRDFLGRNPDADGLRSYREKLTDQGWSEVDVRNHIRRSSEFRAIKPEDVVTKAYRDVLKRDPDPEGLRHYRDLFVNQGWTIPQIRADLLRSDERSDKRIREIINKAFREILGRDPDAGGFETYRKAILEKGWDEAQVRDSLARSAEAREKRAK